LIAGELNLQTRGVIDCEVDARYANDHSPQADIHDEGYPTGLEIGTPGIGLKRSDSDIILNTEYRIELVPGVRISERYLGQDVLRTLYSHMLHWELLNMST
jgi:hypothetical protein